MEDPARHAVPNAALVATTQPEDWEFRGKGAAHIVAAYIGTAIPALRGWLLRVPISSAIPFAADVAIWGRLLGKNIAHWPERYLERIVRRQVTDQYLPETAWIDVPRAVASRFLGAEISAGGRAPGGWIVRDAARVADVPSQCRACLEIKPKCGAMLSCWTVPPSDRPLKRSVSRYRLHQALKCELHAQRQETEESTPTAFVPSEYDPLELFSRNPAKVLCALQALRASPQNNLAGRLWVSVTGRDGQRAETLQDVGFDAVAAAAFESRSDASGLLVEAVRDVLCSEELLLELLAAQTINSLDALGASLLYDAVASPSEDAGAPTPPPPPSAPFEALASDDEHLEAVRAWVAALSPEQRAGQLRGYLAACAARDASILLALAVLPGEGGCSRPAVRQHGRAPGSVPIPGGRLVYLLTIVDVDRKPSAKIPKHLQLDRDILLAARRAGLHVPVAQGDAEWTAGASEPHAKAEAAGTPPVSEA